MKRVAIFDFDNTLIMGDSLMPFLRYAVGVIPAYAAVVEALGRHALLHLQKEPSELRSFVKAFMLERLLKGKNPAELEQAVKKTCTWQVVNEPVMQTLREHHKKGDTIVIASGSLDLYLGELLRSVPHDFLICTDVGVENGVITGVMTHGNCVRETKAERIKAWLEAHGPFDESFGYGNYPHDVPMLNLVKHRIIVS
jgi:HAD superfamily hydrolase (TIGR01490 family)